MATITPFKGLRPHPEAAAKVAALPYDVYNRQEARAEVKKQPQSFLTIDRGETTLAETIDLYSDEVYQNAAHILQTMIDNGTFIQDSKPCYYIYELTRNSHQQTGLVAGAAVSDYLDNKIKKHENTRTEKELDRIRHIEACQAQTGPIFLAYKQQPMISALLLEQKQNPVLYDFYAADGTRHRVWIIQSAAIINTLTRHFETIDHLYIADGHHRAASAVKVAQKYREQGISNPESEAFLAVLFPHDELQILPYHRIVHDWNGHTSKELLALIERDFIITPKNSSYAPNEKGNFGMYLDGSWFHLKASNQLLNQDPVLGLDASILQQHLLTPLLGINDPRTDQRISFAGGHLNLAQLEEKAMAFPQGMVFSMYPTTMDELFAVADQNQLMPPKSTWFEPKLLSGLFIHQI